MKKLRRCLGFGVASLLIGQATLGATLNVDQANPQCTDTGSGTASQPFCTIGAAAAKAVAGTTVTVAAGNYAENVTVASSGTSSAPVVFTAAPIASVTVSGQVHGFTLSSKSWI